MMPRPQPQTIITSHTSADYDALAAMVAAGKLYPDALLVAPCPQERQGSHFFTDSIAYLFGLQQPRDVDLSQVRTLVLVDTRVPARVPHVESVFANPGLAIHVYDHHPDSAEDCVASLSDVRQWGSSTAILAHILMERDLVPSQDEATMMGLGIYEDTGSFTYSSTTQHDLTAAAWLREHGMDLETINELISRDLTREQVQVLNAMLDSAVSHDVKGIQVVFVEASLDTFLGDFAVLAQKIMDMERVKVLFALARMGDRVQVVARSRSEDVDVGTICANLGGGGHAYAASASIKHRTIGEVKTELQAILLSTVNPQVTVGEHMTSPVTMVDDSSDIAHAEEVMNRYGLKALPVVATGTRHCVGYLELQTASRAIAHGLGSQSVSEYMHREVRTVSPESTLLPAMEIILNQRQRLVPVVSKGNVVGVLTRTDVLRLVMVDPLLRIPEPDPLDASLRERHIETLLRTRLPAEHVSLLEQAGKLGDKKGWSVFIVGGFVRDMLLGRSNLDIDICIEGDGIEFARLLAEKLGGRMRSHRKFRTAVVIFTNDVGKEQRIDVATARLEYYEHPGALPTVELSSIKMDLFRRDFTINALAVQINRRRFGVLIDPFGAQRDIKEKSINVLHSLSFVEDPTRIMRGIRFETRFGFRLGQQTRQLVKNAVRLGMLDRVSGPRLFNEMKHIFDEQDAAACIARLEHFEVWRAIHENLRITPNKTPLLREAEEVLAWHERMYTDQQAEKWMVYLLIMLTGAKYTEVLAVLDRLGVVPKVRSEFMRLRENGRQVRTRLPAWKSEDGSMSGLYDLLARLPLEATLALIARSADEPYCKDITHFLTRLSFERIDIDGDDLTAMGVLPGPAFARILHGVLAAKLDGEVKSREEQLALARSLAALK